MERSSHGLRAGALGLAAGIAIGVASTAPAYSLTSTLTAVSKSLGASAHLAPAVIVAAFVPILLIAIAFAWANRLEPDCGTSFAWVLRTMGPWWAWMTGWSTVMTGMLVMASLGQVAGTYSLALLGADGLAGQQMPVTAIGIGWIGVMTWLSVRGIQPSAVAQSVLVALELLCLLAFGAVGLVLAAQGGWADSATPGWSWFALHAVHDASALTAALVTAVFIYWGWESAVSVNEETRDSRHLPGYAALISVIVLMAIYLVATLAAQAVHGPQFIADHGGDDIISRLARDMFEPPWHRVVALAILLSVVAAAQTTLIPTARTLLAMAAAGAVGPAFGKVHPAFRTPLVATVFLSVASCVWFLAVSLITPQVLEDTIYAIGLLVAGTYALSGLACAKLWLRVREKPWHGLLLGVALPLAGAAALLLVLAGAVLRFLEENPRPLWFASGCLVLGVVVMGWRFRRDRRFFCGRGALSA